MHTPTVRPAAASEIALVAHVCTQAVQTGFLPAAKALGLRVVLLTDRAQAHREQFAQPGLPAYPDEIVGCDVFNPLALLDALTRRTRRPVAIFSNSDHLQASTAAAARYLGLPGKPWQTAYRAKNKAEMRAHLAAGIDTLWHALVCDAAALQALREALPWPCIVKPREGVASQHVGLARSRRRWPRAAWTLRRGSTGACAATYWPSSTRSSGRPTTPRSRGRCCSTATGCTPSTCWWRRRSATSPRRARPT